MAIRGEIILCILPSTGTFTFNHAIHTSDAGKGFVFIEAASIDSNNQEIYSVGYADGSLNNIGNAGGQGEAFGVCISSRAYSNVYSILSESTSAFFGGAVARMRAYVSAVRVGSFDVTVDLNLLPGAGYYCVMLTGDSDVSIKVGIAQIPAGLNQTIDVNLGYPAVALLTLGAPFGVNGEVAGLYHNNGFATLCGPSQAGMSCATGSINNNAASYSVDSFIEQDYNIVTKAFIGSGTSAIFSWNPNGFTAKRIQGTTSFGMWDIGYMAIGGVGVSANLVRITQPSSTGVQAISLLMGDPVLAFFSSRCKPSSSGVSADANMFFGAFAGGSMACVRFAFPNGTPFPYSRDAGSLTTACISMITATAKSVSTLNAEASATLASNNLNVNWTTADSTPREVWSLVLGNNPSGVLNGCGNNPAIIGAGIYKIVLNKKHDTIYNPFPLTVDVKIP